MSDSADDSSDKGEKSEPQPSNASHNESAATSSETPGEAGQNSPTDSHLPVIWSPKLDAGEAIEHESPMFDAHKAESPREELATEESTGDAAATAAPARSSRFALL